MAGKKIEPPIITKEEAGKLPDYLVEMINRRQIKFKKEDKGAKAPESSDLPIVKYAVRSDGTVAGKLM